MTKRICDLCKQPWNRCRGHGRLRTAQDFDRFDENGRYIGDMPTRGQVLAEEELQAEMRNQGIQNQPEPICCPICRGDLQPSQGMVGERVLVCPADGIVWEDQEDAIRRVF